MLDFGFSEILLTSAIALVVLGPERLPRVARKVGNWMGRARLMARQLSEQLEREVNAEELLRESTKPAAVDRSPACIERTDIGSDILGGRIITRGGGSTTRGGPAAAAASPQPDAHSTAAAAMHPAAEPAPASVDPKQSSQ